MYVSKLNKVIPIDDILGVLKRKRRSSINSAHNSNSSDEHSGSDKADNSISSDENSGSDKPDDSNSSDEHSGSDKVNDSSASEKNYDSDKKENSFQFVNKKTKAKRKGRYKTKECKKVCEDSYSDSDYQPDDSNSSDENYDSDTPDDSNSSDEHSGSDKVNDSSESEESCDSDKKENSFQYVNKKTKVKKKGKYKSKSSGKSSYEKMIEERKRQQMEFWKSLEINDIKTDLKELLRNKKTQTFKTDEENWKRTKLQNHRLEINSIKEKAKADFKAKKKTQHSKNEDEGIEPLRKTKRIAYQTQSVENQSGSKLSPLRKSKRIAHQTQSVENQPGSKLSWSFKDIFAMDDSIYKEYVEDVSIQSPNETKLLSYTKSTFESLHLDTSKKFLLHGNSFTSLTWCSSAKPLILVAGNQEGNVAIMNIDTDVYFFKPHADLISNLEFNSYNPVQLLSTSLDGKLLCGDLVKHIFSEVYSSDVTCCNYFDILSLTTFLIAHKNGKVALVDNRTWKKRCTQFSCHKNSVETVNLHPLNRNYFVTAENNGTIRLWDLRKIQEHSIAEVDFPKSWSSAFFSPVTGHSILATSNSEVCCFDSTHLTADLNLLCQKKFSEFHSCRARASWVPNSDKLFVVGSVDKKHKSIEVFSKNMKLYYPIMKKKSESNCAFINAFHPHITCFASTYSIKNKGHIFVYM